MIQVIVAHPCPIVICEAYLSQTRYTHGLNLINLYNFQPAYYE